MTEQDRTQDTGTGPAVEPEAVIVGIDGSPPSRNALAWAINEAKSLGKPIRLVGAYTIPSVAAAAIDVSYVPIDDSSIRASVTNTLKEAAAEVKAAGVPVEAVIEIGDAAGVLIDESKTGCLAVVGSRGRGGFAGRLLGTVSSALPAHSKCPTVVVPASWQPGVHRDAHPTSSRPIRHDGAEVPEHDPDAEAIEGLRFDGKVVVGVDSLGADSPALWKAARLAVRRGSPLHIVAVVTTTVIGPEWLPSTADLERLVNEAADKLVVAKQRLKEEFPDLDVTWTLFDGQPAEVLVRASDTAEVLVIGSRGRGGFAGLLLGSTSQSVLPYSQCPTMVVRVARDQHRRRHGQTDAEPGL
ncbi:nucleotide-binding universal stress UspA family protein [Brevibacterium sanguinis]|uniref:Nucleotide-binding universal stress UspA family protein n=2 Tax=Brevibacterium TaxID=1696 RepID=A0A366IJ53_9MICO|nr:MULTISPECIES: universal stress protein [Brevibacterium]RBP65505.1 nucleotide-binding universal stress UspA family protein [Brevibacterium sanguinis]RBP72139.1 nucleotide-binding universal stress UspA family protein [Brevibacterium celere]